MSLSEARDFMGRRAPKKKDGSVVGPWVTDFDAMALKTCLRKLWNLLPAGKSDAARLLQERMHVEADIEAGAKSIKDTAPVDLDLGFPDDDANTTENEVMDALTGEVTKKPPVVEPKSEIKPGGQVFVTLMKHIKDATTPKLLKEARAKLAEYAGSITPEEKAQAEAALTDADEAQSS